MKLVVNEEMELVPWKMQHRFPANELNGLRVALSRIDKVPLGRKQKLAVSHY
jgi:hypothetical protein